jgi:hypothetical protein
MKGFIIRVSLESRNGAYDYLRGFSILLYKPNIHLFKTSEVPLSQSFYSLEISLVAFMKTNFLFSLLPYFGTIYT